MTLVDRVPAWRGNESRDLPLKAPDQTPGPVMARNAGQHDTELDVPILPDPSAGESRPWQDDELMRPEDTFVDAVATAVDKRAVAEDAASQGEDIEHTLPDTPTLLVSPSLAPTRRPGGATRRAESVTGTKRLPPAPDAEPAPPRPTIEVPPLRPRSNEPSARRNEREALARVIALAKPRVTPPRPKSLLRPLRTAEGG